MAEQLIELNVTGMHCNNCAMSVHKLLEKKGLQNIHVDFASEEVKFSNENDADLSAIKKDIEGLGYRVVDNPELQVVPFYEKVENKFIREICKPALPTMFLRKLKLLIGGNNMIATQKKVIYLSHMLGLLSEERLTK